MASYTTSIEHILTGDDYISCDVIAACIPDPTSLEYEPSIGICWSSKNKRPTYVDNGMILGVGSGTFPVVIKDLLKYTTYYLRSYTVNSDRVYTYGKEVSATPGYIEAPPEAPPTIPGIPTRLPSIVTQTSQVSVLRGIEFTGSTLDDRWNMWLDKLDETFPDYYKSQLYRMSDSERLRELRKRGFWT